MNQLTTNNSLLSREDSTSLKGFLILLIVLGHNIMLNQPPTAKSYDEDFLPHRLLLYYFHVHCFFILPMIYGYKQKYVNAKDNIVNDIKKAFVKTFVPYTFFCILFIVLNQFRGFNSDWGGVAWAYIVGEQTLHAAFLDEHFLWFLPAMFALLVWKSVYYNSSLLLKSVIFFLSIGLIIMYVFRVIEYNSIYWNVLPLSLMRGLYYLSWGITARYFIELKWNRACVWGWVILVCSTIIVLTDGKLLLSMCNMIVFFTFIMTIAVFLLLYRYKHCFKCKILQFIGKYSLYIYLYNVIVYNLVNLALLHYFVRSYMLGIVSFFLTIVICIGLSILTDRTAFVKKILFPSI